MNHSQDTVSARVQYGRKTSLRTICEMMSRLDLSKVLLETSYIYGGFGAPNGTGLDDIYILSLPSFQWILVSVPQPLSTISYTPRFGRPHKRLSSLSERAGPRVTSSANPI
jgi:hypothetical protein